MYLCISIYKYHGWWRALLILDPGAYLSVHYPCTSSYLGSCCRSELDTEAEARGSVMLWKDVRLGGRLVIIWSTNCSDVWAMMAASRGLNSTGLGT